MPGIGLVVLALLAATPARKREARAVLERSVKEYDLGQFEAALADIQRAYLLDPQPEELFNVGQCERALHHWELAETAYERYLREKPDAPNRKLVETRLAEMAARIAEAEPKPPPAAAAEQDLQRGIADFENLDDAGATSFFRRVLFESPTSSQAARAHMFLGLIAFNALQPDQARAHFLAALSLNPYSDLPPDASPKARMFIEQLRASTHWAGPALPPQVTRPAPPPVEVPVVVAAPPPAKRPSRWPAYLTGALSLALLGTGVGFGIGQSQAQTSLGQAREANQATSASQAYGRDGLAADVLFAVGGAAGVAAVVLFAFPPGGGEPSATVSAGAGSVRLAGSW